MRVSSVCTAQLFTYRRTGAPASYSEDAGDMDTEPPEDLMAIEEEELRNDARGVEERDAPH